MKTFGSISFVPGKDSPGTWFLHTRPDITIKLKRLFDKVASYQHDTISLTHSLETCRDIQWFLQRYPLVWENPSDKDLLDSTAKDHIEQEYLVDSLLKNASPPRAFDLAIPAREYQKLAAELTLQLNGLLLADDMGLGKTVSAIAVLSHPETRPALVVCLAHLPKQWEQQIHKFCPGLTTHIVKKSKPYDLKTLPDVLITTYHKLNGWAAVLGDLVKTVIYDEIQELRRGKASAKGNAALFLSTKMQYRLGLSATPVYNYGGEIWPVIEAVRPGYLGTEHEFHQEWCGRMDSKGRTKLKNPKVFGTYLRESGLMLRRTRAEVGAELPGLTKIPYPIECDSERVKAVENSAISLAETLLASQGVNKRGEAWKAAEELSNLVRQATGIAKAPHVADFVRMLADSEEKLLLFGWHRECYAIWLERLADLKPVLFTGSESPAAKARSVQAFCEGDSRVLIMSLRSGLGIDGLQEHCCTTIHGELDWSPGYHDQSDGRVFRDGQTKPVFAYYPLANEGSDPIVSDILGFKRNQSEGIRNPNRDLVVPISELPEDHIKALAKSYLRKKGA